MKRLRVAAVALVIVVALVAAAAWWWRDLPRRRVEAALEGKLSAEVRLGRLEIRGLDRFVLHDLEVRRVAGQPRLVHAVVRRLEADGGARAMLEGRFDRLGLRGAEVRLGPPDPSIPPPPPGPPAKIAAGVLTLAEGRLVIATEGGETALDVDADLSDFGGTTSGTAHAVADTLPLAPFGVRAELRDVATTARFSGNEVALDAVAVADGTTRIAANGTMDLVTIRLLDVDAEVSGIDVARWLPLVPGRPEGLEVSGRVDLRARMPRGAPLAWTLEARLDEPPGEASLAGTLDAVDLLAGGAVRGTLTAEPASIPIVLELDGNVTLRPEARYEGTATARIEALPPVAVSGHATPRQAAATFAWEGAAIDALVPLAARLGVTLPESLTIDGALTGRARVAWPAVDHFLDADVTVARLAARWGETMRLDDATLRAKLATAAIGAPWIVRELALSGRAQSPPLAAVTLTLGGMATVDPATASCRDASLAFTAGDLARGTIAGAWDPRTGGAADVEVRGLEATRWQGFLRPLIGDPAPGFAAKGAATATLRVALDPSFAWSATGTAAIVGSGFASDDGGRVLEGLDTRWALAGSGSGSAVRATATAEVGGFQALWGSFFADYSGLPSTLAADAAVDGAAWTGSLRWAWPGGPLLQARVTDGAGNGRIGYGVTLEIEDLGSTLSRYLREPLGSTVPFFEKIGGRGALRLEAGGTFGDDAIVAAGSVRSSGLSVAGTQGVVEVEGLELDLPFDLRWGPPGPGGSRPLDGREREGSLRFSRFAAAGMEIPETSTGLRIRTDSVELVEPLAVPLLDGLVGFERLTLTEFARPSRRLEMAMLLSKIDLATASKAFGLPPLTGFVDGYFPKVVVTGASFQVDGGGEVGVFGGKVRIGGISGEDVLTRFPKIRLSADFEEIDLALVTRTLDFGDMSGIVRGHVHDLTLFRGVPTSFEARLETVEREGVRGRINLKAVNNLAILSTGSPGLLDRGIQKFIDAFTYQRLGIELSLANDVFLMRGLEKRGDRELFVRGRLPFPIDIVNAQPGRTVSFRAMRERIGNVDFKVGGSGPPRKR
ncbi:MAG TPA: hypothetical protein VF139_13825 [Candidatus Polarisedimenticolaceae bacterium]